MWVGRVSNFPPTYFLTPYCKGMYAHPFFTTSRNAFCSCLPTLKKLSTHWLIVYCWFAIWQYISISTFQVNRIDLYLKCTFKDWKNDVGLVCDLESIWILFLFIWKVKIKGFGGSLLHNHHSIFSLKHIRAPPLHPILLR